ncbi:MAG: hypothetical protein O7H39_04780, partial [Gammaproteobacteria bacterium]|nr:hypothetical protein [Gammaproteobacteria bacterium]
MIASFPWYDLGPVRWANDAIWQAVRARLSELSEGGLPALPLTLDRRTPVREQWRSAELLVSHACGLDLLFEDAIEPVLAPVFDLPGCRAGHYFSYLVAGDAVDLKRDDLVAAVNSRRSHSGFTALFDVVQPGSIELTGSHRSSIDAVQRGACDVACIDAMTWRILGCPSDGLVVVERTREAPAPPYVSAAPVIVDSGSYEGAEVFGLLSKALREVL